MINRGGKLLTPANSSEIQGCTGQRVSVTNRIVVHKRRLLAAEPAGTLGPPVSVEVHPTLSCNANCSFCFYSSEFGAGKYLLNERLQSLADELVQLGVKSVTISGGGEPLIHPGLPEFIFRLTRGGLEVGLITNGQLIRRKHLPALAQCSWIKFSMHASSPAGYARAFNVPPEQFSYTCDSFLRLKRRTLRTVLSVGYVVGSHNADPREICEFVTFGLLLLGADYILFRAYDGLEFELTEQQLEALSAVENVVNRIAGQAGRFTNYSAFLRDARKERRHTEGKCEVIDRGLLAFIDATGAVYPCLPRGQRFGKEAFRIGNINEQSMLSIWNDREHLNVLHSINMSSCPWCKYEKMLPIIDKLVSGCEQMPESRDPHQNFL